MKILPLADDEEMSVVFDNSNDQPERFPNGYYIVVVLKWQTPENDPDKKGFWYNSGRVAHVATLNELEK